MKFALTKQCCLNTHTHTHIYIYIYIYIYIRIYTLIYEYAHIVIVINNIYTALQVSLRTVKHNTSDEKIVRSNLDVASLTDTFLQRLMTSRRTLFFLNIQLHSFNSGASLVIVVSVLIYDFKFSLVAPCFYYITNNTSTVINGASCFNKQEKTLNVQ